MNYDGSVIILHRAISLSRNDAVSIDFMFFTDMNKEEYKNYGQYVKNLNPQFILAPSYDNKYKNFKNCDLKLIIEEKNIGRLETRKPFSRGNLFNGKIFKINPEKLPGCYKIVK